MNALSRHWQVAREVLNQERARDKERRGSFEPRFRRLRSK
jgi:hypothetical protein